MNKSSLEIAAEELERIIQEEERNPSPKSKPKNRLFSLSIITISIFENLLYLKGYLDKEENAQFKFIAALGYIFNLDILIKDNNTPINYISRLKTLYDMNDVMYEQIDTKNYDLIYKTIKEMFDISVSLWLEDIQNYDLEPLKVLRGKEQEDYMRLLTDLEYKQERHHENMIQFFIKIYSDPKL